MNWKAGDIAICINIGDLYGPIGNNPPLRLNYEYVVGKVKTCECGLVTLDVGINNTNPKGILCKCGARSSPSSGIWWCDARRFKKKEYATSILKEIFQTSEFN